MAAKKTQVKSKVAAFHTLEAGTPYRNLSHNRTAFSAFTLAALAVSGYLQLTAKSATKARSKGNTALFKKLVGKTAFKTWKVRMNKEQVALSADGLNEVSARLAGESHYSTDMITVKEFVTAIQNGGTLKVGPQAFDFCATVTAE